MVHYAQGCLTGRSGAEGGCNETKIAGDGLDRQLAEGNRSEPRTSARRPTPGWRGSLRRHRRVAPPHGDLHSPAVCPLPAAVASGPSCVGNTPPVQDHLALDNSVEHPGRSHSAILLIFQAIRSGSCFRQSPGHAGSRWQRLGWAKSRGLSRGFRFRNCFISNTQRAAKTDDCTHFLRPATLLTRC